MGGAPPPPLGFASGRPILPRKIAPGTTPVGGVRGATCPLPSQGGARRGCGGGLRRRVPAGASARGDPARGRPPAPTPGPTGSRDLSGFPRSLGGQMPAAAGRPPAPTHPGVSHPPEFSELADDRRTGAPQSPARLKARGSRARKGAASRSTPASGRPPCPPEEEAPHANRELPTQIGRWPCGPSVVRVGSRTAGGAPFAH